MNQTDTITRKPNGVLMLAVLLVLFTEPVVADSAIGAGQTNSLATDNPLLERGIDLLRAGEWSLAVACFNEAHEREPTNAANYEYRASAKLGLQEWAGAIDDFSRAIQASPTNARVYFNRASAYRMAGRFPQALADLETSLLFDRHIDHTDKLRAAINSHEGRLEEAVADWTEGLRLNPKDAVALACRGSDCGRLGRYADALRDYEQAITLDPACDLALNNLAWPLATCPKSQFRDGARAVGLATRACELTAWKKWSWLETLAAAYAESGDFKSATRWQKQALELEAMSDIQRRELMTNLAGYENERPLRVPTAKSKSQEKFTEQDK